MTGAATGGVRGLLRAEGACVLVASVAAYAHVGAGWWIFALCFLVPDIAFLAYLAGPRAGAAVYNLAHAYVGPLATLTLGLALDAQVATSAALIWSAHIGLDRMLGYGLKYATGFGFTHLGPIGKARAASDRVSG